MKVYLNFEYIISSYRGFPRIFDVKNLIHGIISKTHITECNIKFAVNVTCSCEIK